MSHFTEIQVDFLQKNEKHLVAALEEQFGKGNVEVHENGVGLMGYGGDDRSRLSRDNPNYAPRCQIVIRRRYVGSASNDVGYCRTEDGKYTAYISDYDKGYHYNKAKQDKVLFEYTAKVSEAALKAKGYTYKRVAQKDGTVKIIASKYM